MLLLPSLPSPGGGSYHIPGRQGLEQVGAQSRAGAVSLSVRGCTGPRPGKDSSPAGLSSPAAVVERAQVCGRGGRWGRRCGGGMWVAVTFSVELEAVPLAVSSSQKLRTACEMCIPRGSAWPWESLIDTRLEVNTLTF